MLLGVCQGAGEVKTGNPPTIVEVMKCGRSGSWTLPAADGVASLAGAFPEPRFGNEEENTITSLSRREDIATLPTPRPAHSQDHEGGPTVSTVGLPRNNSLLVSSKPAFVLR